LGLPLAAHLVGFEAVHQCRALPARQRDRRSGWL